ncbi:acyl-CoA dehydrogenase [Streptomyces sp. ME02-8801-2C]|uniref:acyl-CoA dehydrogenase family protein n=1 Tax=Streptomyces sp. ME02-8801-2C TaxID=3028680 RepID=UPI0029AB25A1|nr:acyl-CoA dehydrogenase [Streptomyces sp. ME02-8801-2C]MDX3457435.1 acyl-CoA dehydrogenase [Streptomyces sp. ME02-8801-2C]
MTSATVLGPAESDEGDAGRAELSRLIFDGTYEDVHADIRALLLDPAFDARDGLSLPEAGRLAYERSRFVHGRLERPLEILKNPRRLFALAEWPSLLDVSTFSLLMVHYNLCLGTVAEHGGDREDLKDHLEELDSLESFGPYMATELGYGNNVAALRTEAVYDRHTETFVINTPDPLAQKYMSYSGFQDVPKVAVVLARLKADGKDHGVYPFVVRISDAGGLCEGIHAAPCPEKPVQGLDNGLTWFDHVRVPRRNLLLGDRGEFTPEGAFKPGAGNQRKRFLKAMSRIQPGRLCVSSAAVGAGRASVYIALRYAARRLTNAPGRNDMPVIEYRSHQLSLFTQLAKVYAMTFLLNHAKRAYLREAGEISAELGVLIALTKALTTWEMTETVAVCRERCGAQGIFSANRIADYGSLLQGLVTAEGDNQVLLATTAGQLLARPAAETAGATRAERGPHGLLDVRLLVEILGERERSLHEEGRARMSDDSGRTYFEAWNSTMNSALAMARTRAVRVALESFEAAVGEAHEPSVRVALRELALLYALTEVRRDAGWYLAQGALTADEVRALPDLLDEVCTRVLPYTSLLIDGFRLSPELLRAPIAADDYVSAFQSLTGGGK